MTFDELEKLIDKCKNHPFGWVNSTTDEVAKVVSILIEKIKEQDIVIAGLKARLVKVESNQFWGHRGEGAKE